MLSFVGGLFPLYHRQISDRCLTVAHMDNYSPQVQNQEKETGLDSLPEHDIRENTTGNLLVCQQSRRAQDSGLHRLDN